MLWLHLNRCIRCRFANVNTLFSFPKTHVFSAAKLPSVQRSKFAIKKNAITTSFLMPRPDSCLDQQTNEKLVFRNRRRRGHTNICLRWQTYLCSTKPNRTAFSGSFLHLLTVGSPEVGRSERKYLPVRPSSFPGGFSVWRVFRWMTPTTTCIDRMLQKSSLAPERDSGWTGCMSSRNTWEGEIVRDVNCKNIALFTEEFCLLSV